MVQLSVEPRWKHISFQIWVFTIHLTVAFTLHLSCNSEAEATSSHMGFPMKNWMSKIWREGGHFSYLIQTYYYYLEQQAPLKQQRGINCCSSTSLSYKLISVCPECTSVSVRCAHIILVLAKAQYCQGGTFRGKLISLF